MNAKATTPPKKPPGIGHKNPAPAEMRAPRGYGAMRDQPLDVDPRVDLTRPIYEQVLELEHTNAAAE